jgi:hydroxypyruvate isomerase
MAGKLDIAPNEDHHRTYEENLKFAAKELEANNIIGVIEPINKYAVPGYYLNSYDRGNKVFFSLQLTISLN